MHDAVALEDDGCPTAVVVTERFVDEARTQLEALGVSELVPVVVTHPVSTLSAQELTARAREAVSQIEQVLTP